MALAVQRSFDDLGTPLHAVTFVVLDVETTGGSPATASLSCPISASLSSSLDCASCQVQERGEVRSKGRAGRKGIRQGGRVSGREEG